MSSKERKLFPFEKWQLGNANRKFAIQYLRGYRSDIDSSISEGVLLTELAETQPWGCMVAAIDMEQKTAVIGWSIRRIDDPNAFCKFRARQVASDRAAMAKVGAYLPQIKVGYYTYNSDGNPISYNEIGLDTRLKDFAKSVARKFKLELTNISICNANAVYKAEDFCYTQPPAKDVMTSFLQWVKLICGTNAVDYKQLAKMLLDDSAPQTPFVVVPGGKNNPAFAEQPVQ